MFIMVRCPMGRETGWKKISVRQCNTSLVVIYGVPLRNCTKQSEGEKSENPTSPCFSLMCKLALILQQNKIELLKICKDGAVILVPHFQMIFCPSFTCTTIVHLFITLKLNTQRHFTRLECIGKL